MDNPSVSSSKEACRVTLVRTAERVDRMFPTWTKDCFTNNGKYIPTDLNLPIRLPYREPIIAPFSKDPPITEFGRITAQLVGRGLRLSQLSPNKVFASPALRCVQTATYILRLLENRFIKICIEPGLFEWTQWYDKPTFMTTKEMQQAGYPVDTKYQPIISAAALELQENEQIQSVYRRIERTLNGIVDRFPGESVLIVGHGITMDAGARGLLGKQQGETNETDMTKIGLHYPYNSTLVLGQDSKKKWQLKDGAMPPISYLDFTNRINHAFLNRA